MYNKLSDNIVEIIKEEVNTIRKKYNRPGRSLQVVFGSITIAVTICVTKEPNCLWAFLILAWS